jgi:hypothetical protein
MHQLIETVEDLQSRGIELRSLTESIDTATPGGWLVFQIFGALAKFERAVQFRLGLVFVIHVEENGKQQHQPFDRLLPVDADTDN